MNLLCALDCRPLVVCQVAEYINRRVRMTVATSILLDAHDSSERRLHDARAYAGPYASLVVWYFGNAE